MSEENPFDYFKSRSRSAQSVLEIAQRIAPHEIPLLIEGETGVGKEQLAKAIHFSGSRGTKEFAIVDCSGLSETLLECELFGYVRGSFAGAIHEKKGLLEIAEGGTIYLDHIDQLTPAFQGKLLRWLNDQAFYKIGGVTSKTSHVRLIAATTKDLKVLVEKKKFRQDLYYRLNVMRIMIPPLRERHEDVLTLAEHFLNEIAAESRSRRKDLSQEARRLLESYRWPGNVRELKEELKKSVILSGANSQIMLEHLSAHIQKGSRSGFAANHQPGSASPLKEQKQKLIALLEKDAIRAALKKTLGNRTHAAKLLAISRQDLLRKMASYQIKA